MMKTSKQPGYLVLTLLLASGIIEIKAQTEYHDDVKSVTSITEAYYECISGPIGQKRDFERFRNLFHPTAQFTYSYWDETNQEAKVLTFNMDSYIDALDYLDKRGFYEKEISSTTQRFGSIVQSFSTYEFWMEDNMAAGRGITSYNYIYDGERYWILSMLWTMESDKYPIPEKYLIP